MIRSRLKVGLVLIAGGLLAAPGAALAHQAQAAHGDQYSVSIGDSYAAGFEVTAPGTSEPTTNGYADQVPVLARARGVHLKLVNFACGRATTDSVLNDPGCPEGQEAIGGPAYPTTPQAAAAESFIRQHRADIGLITATVGGNDLLACGATPDVPCISAAAASIQANVTRLAADLRAAAGPTTPIIGLTYPNVQLALALTGSPEQALLSVGAFNSVVNPALSGPYRAAGAKFIDVTKATGAYGSFLDTTDLAPFGTIPTPVAKLCQLTFVCESGNIHPRTNGYTLIAQLIVAALPSGRSAASAESSALHRRSVAAR
jgi:lysophospholipase L1-like esterase